jgi:hypothetical protein
LNSQQQIALQNAQMQFKPQQPLAVIELAQSLYATQIAILLLEIRVDKLSSTETSQLIQQLIEQQGRRTYPEQVGQALQALLKNSNKLTSASAGKKNK